MATANVIITHACNMACSHCFQGNSDGMHAQSEKIVHALEKLKQYGFDKILLTGGECTTHPHFLEILKQSKKTGFRTGVFTNGFELGHTVLPLVDYISLSLDGTEPVHDTIRKPDSYRRTIDALELCKCNKIETHVQITLQKNNIGDITNLIPVLKRFSSVLESVSLMAVSPEGRASDNGLILENPYEATKIKEEFQYGLGFSIPARDNVCLAEDAHSIFCRKRSHALWVDCVSDRVYHAAGFDETTIKCFDSEWDETDNRRINSAVEQMRLPRCFLTDEIYLHIANPSREWLYE